jgi:hypothetical protein
MSAPTLGLAIFSNAIHAMDEALALSIGHSNLLRSRENIWVCTANSRLQCAKGFTG